MKKRRFKHFYIESYGRWMIVKAYAKRIAKSFGVGEFGRGMVSSVREAEASEIEYYKSQYGEIGEAS